LKYYSYLMETNGAAPTRLQGPWNPYDPNCPTRQLLDVIGDRWTVLIVGALEERTRRFSELRALIRGISPKVLTQSLRTLERDGILRRHIFAEVPPRVEYSLTDLGRELIEPIVALRAWAETHIERILAAREQYDGQP